VTWEIFYSADTCFAVCYNLTNFVADWYTYRWLIGAMCIEVNLGKSFIFMQKSQGKLILQSSRNHVSFLLQLCRVHDFA